MRCSSRTTRRPTGDPAYTGRVSDFFELFNPGLRHTRQQRDLEKTAVVDYENGIWGPKPHDLESGEVTITMPSRPSEPDSTTAAD